MKILIIEYAAPDFLANNYSGTAKCGFNLFNFINQYENNICYYASYCDNKIKNMLLIDDIKYDNKYDFIIINGVPDYSLFSEQQKKFNMYNKDTKYICISNGQWYDDNFLNEHFDLTLYASKYNYDLSSVKNKQILYNSIDEHLFKDISIEEKNIENSIVISYNYSKGNVDEFLKKIYPLIKIHIPDFKVYITEPKYCEEVQRNKEQYKNDKNIIFLGYSDFNNIFELYKRIPVSWDYPDMDETCPYNAMEHLLNYVHIISPMTDGTQYICSENYKNKFALKYDIKNENDHQNIANEIIDRILNYKKYKEYLIDEHKFIIDNFNIEKICNQFMNILNSMYNLIDNWENKFDQIYIIHLADNHERYEHCNKEFTRMSINKFTFFNCCTHEIDLSIGNFLRDQLKTDYYDLYVYPNNKKLYKALYNVVTNHYNVIKTSYQLGYNYILIFEDDVTFNHDSEYFKNIMNNIPQDFDILKLKSGQGDDPKYQDRLKDDYEFKNVFTKVDANTDELLGISAEGYALSRKGMEIIINELDECLCSFDTVFPKIIQNYQNGKYDINIYINNYDIISQNSNIQSLTT